MLITTHCAYGLLKEEGLIRHVVFSHTTKTRQYINIQIFYVHVDSGKLLMSPGANLPVYKYAKKYLYIKIAVYNCLLLLVSF